MIQTHYLNSYYMVTCVGSSVEKVAAHLVPVPLFQTKHLEEELKEQETMITQLQEECARLEETVCKEHEEFLDLQTRLQELQTQQSSDESEREEEAKEVRTRAQRLQVDVERLKEELEQRKAVLTELSATEESARDALQATTQQLHAEKLLVVEIRQENTILKDKIQGLMEEKTRAEEEKEKSVVNENEEKVKLRRAERNVEDLTASLDDHRRVQTELKEEKCAVEMKLKKVEDELVDVREDKNALEAKNTQLHKANEEIRKMVDDVEEQQQRHNVKEHDFAKTLAEKEGSLKELRDVNCRLEFEIVRLKENTDELDQRRSEVETKYGEAKTSLEKLKKDIAELALTVKRLSEENDALRKSQRSTEEEAAEEKQERNASLLDQYHALIQRYKALERENESLKERLEVANLKAKRKFMSQKPMVPEGIPEQPKSPECTAPAAVSFTPLAHSLSNMDIAKADGDDAGRLATLRQPKDGESGREQAARTLQKPKPIRASALSKRSEEKEGKQKQLWIDLFLYGGNFQMFPSLKLQLSFQSLQSWVKAAIRDTI